MMVQLFSRSLPFHDFYAVYKVWACPRGRRRSQPPGGTPADGVRLNHRTALELAESAQ